MPLSSSRSPAWHQSSPKYHVTERSLLRIFPKAFWIWKHIHVHKVHVYEVYAHEVHAYEVHAREVHAHEVHACEMHAYEVYTPMRCTP